MKVKTQLYLEGQKVGVASQHQLHVIYGVGSDTTSRQIPKGRVVAEGSQIFSVYP